MAGTCTRAGLHAIRFGRGKPAARGVEAEHEHAIEPLVGDEHETAGRIEHDIVRMRARLLGLVRAGLARQVQELMLILERSVRSDGQHRDAAAGVIGHDQELAAGVDRLAHAVFSSRGGPIEQLGPAGLAIEREGAGRVAVPVNAIEEALIAAHGEVGRVDEVADVLDVGPRAAGGIGTIDVDAVAARLALDGRERPYVGEHRMIFAEVCAAARLICVPNGQASTMARASGRSNFQSSGLRSIGVLVLLNLCLRLCIPLL